MGYVSDLVSADQLVRPDRIHSRMFYDPDLFMAEVANIFDHTWLYLCHESEVRHPGDFRVTYLGARPVLVTRSRDGQISVLYNRCRHRGATVCQLESGNQRSFECAYHGWTYDSDGALIGVPLRDGYGPDFSPEEFGLLRVPRVATFQGLVFASASPLGMSLEEHLGNAMPYIERFTGQGEGIEVTGGSHKYKYNGNWKIHVENTVDPYHTMFAHRAYMELRTRRIAGADRFRETRTARDLGNGHGLLDDGNAVHLTVFPNLALLGNQIRVIRPVAAERTEVQLHMVLLKGVPEEENVRRIRAHEDFYGPAGLAGPDDAEIFERVHEGIRATADEWQVLLRGIDAEETDDAGVISAGSQAETAQRAFYREWQSHMRGVPLTAPAAG